MDKHYLTDDEINQAYHLTVDLSATLTNSAKRLEIQSLGVIANAMSSLLLGSIVSSVDPDEWQDAIDLIFSNIKTAAATQISQINAKLN